MGSFTIRYNQNGIIRKKFECVPPYRHKNMWRIPDFDAFAPELNKNIRQALQRATWEIVASDVLRANLTDKRGKPLGAIFANWVVSSALSEESAD